MQSPKYYLNNDHNTTISIQDRRTALRVCLPAFGKLNLSQAAFIGFIISA